VVPPSVYHIKIMEMHSLVLKNIIFIYDIERSP
jgi:hypothetical protein